MAATAISTSEGNKKKGFNPVGVTDTELKFNQDVAESHLEHKLRALIG